MDLAVCIPFMKYKWTYHPFKSMSAVQMDVQSHLYSFCGIELDAAVHFHSICRVRVDAAIYLPSIIGCKMDGCFHLLSSKLCIMTEFARRWNHGFML